MRMSNQLPRLELLVQSSSGTEFDSFSRTKSNRSRLLDGRTESKHIESFLQKFNNLELTTFILTVATIAIILMIGNILW